jgi:hypothetical protein
VVLSAGIAGSRFSSRKPVLHFKGWGWWTQDSGASRWSGAWKPRTLRPPGSRLSLSQGSSFLVWWWPHKARGFPPPCLAIPSSSPGAVSLKAFTQADCLPHIGEPALLVCLPVHLPCSPGLFSAYIPRSSERPPSIFPSWLSRGIWMELCVCYNEASHCNVI